MPCEAQVHYERWYLCVTTTEGRPYLAVYYHVATLKKLFLVLVNLTGFRYPQLYRHFRLPVAFEMDSMIYRTTLPHAPRAAACLLGSIISKCSPFN